LNWEVDVRDVSSIGARQVRRGSLAFISLKEPIIKIRYHPRATSAVGDGFQSPKLWRLEIDAMNKVVATTRLRWSLIGKSTTTKAAQRLLLRKFESMQVVVQFNFNDGPT
jgi:hypothetical protein